MREEGRAISVGGALRTALVDFYHQSWRLFLLNTALSALVLAVVGAALFLPAALALALLVGPLAAALMHCAVTLAQTEELRLGDALTGLRLHWRRGLGLGVLVVAVVVLGVVALGFYARIGGWTGFMLLALVAYLLSLFGLLQLSLWPLAVFERDRPLRGVLADAVLALIRRPAAFTALALALLVVNAVGTLAILPLLTLTVAYSFLAAAHFALPRNPMREPGTDG